MRKKELFELLRTPDFNKGVRREDSPYARFEWLYKKQEDIYIYKEDNEYFFYIKPYISVLKEKYTCIIKLWPEDCESVKKEDLCKIINKYFDAINEHYDSLKEDNNNLRPNASEYVSDPETKNEKEDLLLELESLRHEIQELKRGNKSSSKTNGFQKYLNEWDSH